MVDYQELRIISIIQTCSIRSVAVYRETHFPIIEVDYFPVNYISIVATHAKAGDDNDGKLFITGEFNNTPKTKLNIIPFYM